MDLIYTDALRIDQGVLSTYSFDMSFGAEENDFEMTLGKAEPTLEFGAFTYIEGTEYGGIVDGVKTVTDGESITYSGRTWHGILNSKVLQPNGGEDYLVVSGDANAVLAALLARIGVGGLFVAEEAESGISIGNYQFTRYCKAYDGIRAMLADNDAKLKIEWKDKAVRLSAVPVVDYTEAPVDGDVATLTVEHYAKKVNHLVCLGRGELADREVVHLYVNAKGAISETQTFTGLDEVADVYDNSSAESLDDLKKGGKERLAELRGIDKAEIALPERNGIVYDIGDIVGASDIRTGVSVAANVSQKIVKINNGAVVTEYKTGG